jgi:hypothetical protein
VFIFSSFHRFYLTRNPPQNPILFVSDKLDFLAQKAQERFRFFIPQGLNKKKS